MARARRVNGRDPDDVEKPTATRDLRVHSEDEHKSSLAVVLNKFEHLPAIMILVQLLQPAFPPRGKSARSSISIDALRLVELSTRTSAVMMGSESEELLRRDALLNVFRTFGQLNRIPVSSSLSVVQHDSFAATVSAHARQSDADLVVVPWSAGLFASEDGRHSGPSTSTQSHLYNPFDSLFGKSPSADKSVMYSHFIRQVFADSPVDVALYVDRGLSGALDGGVNREHHLFMPFFGGADDRAALSFVIQLCDNPAVSATVVRMTRSESVELGISTTDDFDRAKATATLEHSVGFGHSVCDTGLDSPRVILCD